jgi:hypothetical protein
MTSSRGQNVLCWLVVMVGLIASLGYMTRAERIRGFGQLTVASPLPLVFSAFRGIETFALRFEVETLSAAGVRTRMEITPAVYSRFHAPYNLRNVYGAVLSYGPGFREPKELKLLDSVLKHGFCDSGPLARDFGVPEPVEQVTVRASSKTAGHPGEWTLQARCSEGVQP